jgi:hypothetical protein
MAGGTAGESMKAGHHPVKCLRVSSVTKCHTCNWFRVIFICGSRMTLLVSTKLRIVMCVGTFCSYRS